MTIYEAVQTIHAVGSTTLGKWLLGSGAVFLVSLVFWFGVNLGRINQTLLDMARRIERIESDGRDARAAGYGYEPRPNWPRHH